MADCPQCPFCAQQVKDSLFWVRYFHQPIGRLFQMVTSEQAFISKLFNGEAVHLPDGGFTRGGTVVGLDTGRIYVNKSEKALPKWIEEPMLRAAIAAGSELPPIYKKDKKNVDREKVAA